MMVVTPLYFLAGFTPAASAYFFYIFVVFLTCCVFISQAMVCAAYFSTMAISSAFISSIMPLVALFAGVYIPKPQVRACRCGGGRPAGTEHVLSRGASCL